MLIEIEFEIEFQFEFEIGLVIKLVCYFVGFGKDAWSVLVSCISIVLFASFCMGSAAVFGFMFFGGLGFAFSACLRNYTLLHFRWSLFLGFPIAEMILISFDKGNLRPTFDRWFPSMFLRTCSFSFAFWNLFWEICSLALLLVVVFVFFWCLTCLRWGFTSVNSAVLFTVCFLPFFCVRVCSGCALSGLFLNYTLLHFLLVEESGSSFFGLCLLGFYNNHYNIRFVLFVCWRSFALIAQVVVYLGLVFWIIHSCTLVSWWGVWWGGNDILLAFGFACFLVFY